MFFKSDQVLGHIIELNRTNYKHLYGGGKIIPEKKGAEESFGQLLLNAFNNVNDIQNKTKVITEKMITEPDTVNVHDVMISVAEANLALSMTKSIVDRALRAYREIISIR